MRTSVRSFRGEIQDPLRRAYVFVLERPGRQRVGGILGTSMLIAQHGTLDSPCTFFEMAERGLTARLNELSKKVADVSLND